MRVIDIYSKGEYPANALSNFYPHEFFFDGVKCGSMEGFLQSLKYRNPEKQRGVCALTGKTAKQAGKWKFLWKLLGRVWWQGRAYRRDGKEFFALLTRAYAALYKNPDFAAAIKSSDGATLAHTMGGHNKRKTILTEEEFLSLLNGLRNA